MRLGLFALFCFFPAHGIAANLVNNDAAVYFLMTAMIYCGYRWHTGGGWREALGLSGLLLAAGLVKFSGLMVLPALGVLGLFRLAQAENKLSPRLWGQFAVIGAGAAAGFAWGWFLLAYDFPLVPPPVGNAFQDLRGYGLTERLFGLATAGEVFADVRAGWRSRTCGWLWSRHRCSAMGAGVAQRGCTCCMRWESGWRCCWRRVSSRAVL